MPKGVYSREFVKDRFIENFWKRYQLKNNGCWEWTGCRSPLGYGRVAVRLGPKKFKYTFAHRVSWELKNGEIPSGLFICHKCDNPPCINPDHLFLGTPKDNSQDSVAKGRFHFGKRNGAWTKPEKMPRGEKNGSCKYPDLQIENFLKDFYITGGIPKQVSDRNGIDYKYGYQIISGRTRVDIYTKVRKELGIVS